MKSNIIKLLVFCSFILVSCVCETPKNTNTSNGVKTEDTYGQNVPYERVYEWTYKGHEYIGFDGYRRLGVVHNPDCKKCN